MRTFNVYVAIAAFFLLFTGACTQEEVAPEQEKGLQLSEEGQISLGYIDEDGFHQTADENELLIIMDTYRDETNDYTYTAASVVKNGSLYMILSQMIRSDGTQGEVWLHLEENGNDVVLNTQKPIVIISCAGSCNYCNYHEGSTCYFCSCDHPFDGGTCKEIHHSVSTN